MIGNDYISRECKKDFSNFFKAGDKVKILNSKKQIFAVREDGVSTLISNKELKKYFGRYVK